jgi:hypothetical protein
MKKTMLELAVAAAFAAPFAAQAALHDFTFTLDQAQEIAASADPAVPGKRGPVPGPSDGFGAGFARYDDAINTFLFVSVSGTGLVGSISDQHIHVGAFGVSGPVALNMPVPQLNTGGNFSIFGTDIGGLPGLDDRTTLNASEESALLAGNAYFNIHTTFDGAGEIRGQMIPVVAIPEPETYALMLAGLGLVGWVASRRRKTRT